MADQHETDPYALPPRLEAERLRSLERLRLLHTPPEDRFGYITRMARTVLGVPMSAINLMDRERQWCKQFTADHELDFDVPREQSVCRATIARVYQEPEDLAVVYEDLAESEFAELPAVTAGGGVRFYAGFPLFGPGGHPVGTFCIYDSQPRQLTLAERATFAELAAWAQREIESSDRLQALESAQALLRASADSMLDPQMLLEGVRDPATGRVVDFIYREANAAACKDMATTRDELIGRTVLELLPGFAESGPLSYYAQCLETGQPGTLDDYCYDHEIQASSRRYDLRIAPAGKDLISLTFRDVTDRFQTARRIAASETMLRASADSMLDPQALMEAVRDPDGQVVDFRYLSVNQATCAYLGLSESDLVGHTQLEDTPNLEGSELHRRYAQCLQDGQPVILDNYPFFNEILDDGRRYDIRASRVSADLLSLTWRDVTDRFQTEQLLAEARVLERKAAARYRDLMMNSIVPAGLVGLDGRYALVNPAMCAFLGYDEAALLGMTPADVTAPEDVEPGAQGLADLLAGRTSSYRATKRYLHADGHRVWGELSLSCIRSLDGELESLAVQVLDITEQVELLAQQAAADALLRRSMESAAVAMNLASPDGTLYEVNQAMCDFFGYDAQTLLSKTWKELTHPDYLQADLDYVAELVAGRIESYRMRKQYIHADGHSIWGDLSVGCLRRADGRIELTIGQIIDITEEVRAQQRNALLTEQLSVEMASAAQYVKSILPDDLHGEVEVTSRYLPALEVGGDGFHFGWLDDDHLMMYLIDVSGHGIRPALLSSSVNNLIRSGSLPVSTLLHPDQVLNRLNKLFPMEDQADSYFTIWYGIYQASTRTLRYASAGHPPALALNHDGHSVTATPLSTPSAPIGTFDDTPYTTAEFTVPPGGQVLIYSDGAYEFENTTGDLMSYKNFSTLITTQAARPDWSLDTLVNELRTLTPLADFDDDCALVLLTCP